MTPLTNFSIIFGVDPGKQGGLGILIVDADTGKILYYHSIPMPLKGEAVRTLKKIRSKFEDAVNWHCCIEKVSPMKGWGTHTYKVLFCTQGGIEAAIDYITKSNASFLEITPNVWKKFFGIHKDNRDKELSIQKCEVLFPKLNLTPGKKIKKHDGMAEALLIAEYYRRELFNESNT